MSIERKQIDVAENTLPQLRGRNWWCYYFDLWGIATAKGLIYGCAGIDLFLGIAAKNLDNDNLAFANFVVAGANFLASTFLFDLPNKENYLEK